MTSVSFFLKMFVRFALFARKETNIANALKQNTVVLEEKQTRIMPNMSTADYKGNNFIGQNVSQVVPIEKTVINAKNTSADLSTMS